MVPHRRSGVLDEHGYLTLVGRLKELINRGGRRSRHAKIDEVLLAHPAVAEAVAFRRAASHLGRGSGSGGRPPYASGAASRIWSHIADRACPPQVPEADPHDEAIPRNGHGQDSAACRCRGVLAQGLMKIVIVGAGRSADTSARGCRAPARMSSSSPAAALAGHARSRPPRDKPGRRFRGPAERRRRSLGDRPGRHRLSRRQGPQPDRPCAALFPLFGPDTTVVSTQNGIPWWYFQESGDAFEGIRLERVDPAASSRPQSNRVAWSDRSRTSPPTSPSRA